MTAVLAAFERAPVLAAWGAGVDSTAMIIEMVARGEPVDAVLMAGTGSERPETDFYGNSQVPLRRAFARGEAVTSGERSDESGWWCRQAFEHVPPLFPGGGENGSDGGEDFGAGVSSEAA